MRKRERERGSLGLILLSAADLCACGLVKRLGPAVRKGKTEEKETETPGMTVASRELI